MNVQELEGQGTIGVKVDLTVQEMRVIKNKWVEITKDMNFENNVGNRRIQVNRNALVEFDALLDKILGEVESDQQVHDMLFGDDLPPTDLPLHRE